MKKQIRQDKNLFFLIEKTISEQARAEKGPSKTKKQPTKKVQQTGKAQSSKVEKKQKDVAINNGNFLRL